MGKSGKERQAALAERRKASGQVQVALWVPASRKAELAAFAAALCEAERLPSEIPRHDDSGSASPAPPVTTDEMTETIGDTAPVVTTNGPSDSIAPSQAEGTEPSFLTPEKGPAPITTKAAPLRISPAVIGDDASPAGRKRPRQLDIEDMLGTRPPTPSAPAKGQPRAEWAEYGASVRKAREAKGWGQSALAKLAGTARGTITNIESGRFNAGPEVRTKLNAILNLEG